MEREVKSPKWHALLAELRANQQTAYQCYWALRTGCILCIQSIQQIRYIEAQFENQRLQRQEV